MSDEVKYDEWGEMILDDDSQDSTERDDVKDSNGNVLKNGDSVILTKDLPLKGSSIKFKRGHVMKNIKLIDDSHVVECRIGKTTAVIKTEFLKKK